MKTVTIDPSIASKVNIDSIGYTEDANIYYLGSQNWVGMFEVKIWNSDKKNTPFLVTNALVVVDNLMTLTIKPSAQGLAFGSYYYEISSQNRTIFLGDLIIRR
jgi:hypothetical protein